MAHSKLGCLLVTIAALSGTAESHAVDADAETVYAVNLDLRLSSGESRHQASRRVRVYEGHTIPIEFVHFRVDLKVSGVDENTYLVELRLFERTDKSRYPRPHSTYWQINPAPIEITGTFSHPLELRTDIGDIEVDLAIAVSRKTLVQASAL